MKIKTSTYNQLQNLCWSEDNRLEAFMDNSNAAYYSYDANGDRTLKYTGSVSQITQNGQTYNYPYLYSTTLYAGALITINKTGYTKHYFEESKRICSSIGGGFSSSPRPFDEPLEPLYPAKQLEGIQTTYDKCMNTSVVVEEFEYNVYNAMLNEKNRNATEHPFCYQGDHLGSSTYITDNAGLITQTLAYLPYGEEWVDLDNQPPYLTNYKFNGKEKDEETGFNYYGARYYWDKGSFWLSVDPMSDKYPNLTSYNYCANSPVMLIDPNGRSFSDFDESGNYLKTTKDNWWHNFWHGRTGRIVDGNGNITQSFKFSDPKSDVKDLKNGKINKVHFVQESEIESMLSKAGAFDYENKVANSDSRYDYIKKEGKGGGKFDFALTGIPDKYSDYDQSLFLVDGKAYNQFNYGNFLFGAAGKALGLTGFELLMGAHYNSVFNSSTNGYKPQLDSRDDQRSIQMGVRHADQHGYKNMYYRVNIEPLQRH